MTTNSQLKTEIFTEVQSFANSNSLKVAYPGINFDPPSGDIWLELTIFQNDIDYGLSDSKKFLRGMVQINVCTHKGVHNDIELQQVADSIQSNWPIAQAIIGSVRVSTNPSSMDSFVREDSHYILPVSFEYAE